MDEKSMNEKKHLAEKERVDKEQRSWKKVYKDNSEQN